MTDPQRRVELVAVMIARFEFRSFRLDQMQHRTRFDAHVCQRPVCLQHCPAVYETLVGDKHAVLHFQQRFQLRHGRPVKGRDSCNVHLPLERAHR
jgi:hypothetical protein